MSEDALRAELAECRQQFHEHAAQLRAQLAQVTAERDAWRADRDWVVKLLSRYGHHDNDCPLHHEANLPGDSRCTCGFSASLA